jgi:hypothetical protein
MPRFSFLLPRFFRKAGIIFFIAGVILGVARFQFGYKPHFLDMKPFAFYSSYLQSRYMEVVRNNMAEEFTGFFLVCGLFFIAFAKEKEENGITSAFRLKAFFIAFYLDFLFMLVSLFFTFGFAFLYMLMVNMGVALIAYIVAFQLLLFINRRKPPET